ncbi:MAG: DUF3783 domain-containing protein [Eubacterium sp.]|nr:DUF3783 domain-containing protein [Eubacterium sp.]
MKSRVVPVIPETILSYNIGEKAAMLSAVAERLGIKHTEIPTDKAGESVGFLAGYPGFPEKGGQLTAEGECVIFSGITSNRLNAVLKEMREAGLNIPLKATVTAYNQSESIEWLIAELEKERAAIEKRKNND